MKSLSSILEKQSESIRILSAEINAFYHKMNAKLPKDVQTVLYILNKHPEIDSKEKVLSILNGTPVETTLSKDNLQDLQKMMKRLGDKIRLLPHMMTEYERQALEAGRLAQSDITMDLESDKGRDAVAKVYAPLVFKISNQFVGKSALGKDEIISAGLEGLTKAMNDFRKPDEQEKIGMTFKQYAAYRIRQNIIDELNYNGRNVKMGQYQFDKLKKAGLDTSLETSIDNYVDGDGDPTIDRILDLSNEPDYSLNGNEEKMWKEVFKRMEKQFTERECNIFYRSLGLNGMKKEKGKDIAKDMHVTPAAISQTLRRVMAWLSKDKDSLDVLRDVLSLYVESLVVDLYYKPKQEILEHLINDDMFILLEELNQFGDAKSFEDSVVNCANKFSVSEANVIYNCIMHGYEFIEKNFKQYKRTIIGFLNYLYPTDSFSRKNDSDIIDAMVELNELYKKFNIEW